MSGLDEGVCPDCGVGEEADGQGAVRSGDACGDADGGIDTHGEGGFVAFAISASHLREIEFFRALGGDGGADEATGMNSHEIDHFRGAE